MKNSLLLIAIFCFSIVSTFAQVPSGNSINWSTPIDGFVTEFCGQNNNYIIMLYKMNGLYDMKPERGLIVLNSSNYKEVNRSKKPYIIIDNKNFIYRWGTVFGNKVYAYVTEYVKQVSSSIEPLKQKSYIIRLSLPSLKIEEKWLTNFSTEIYDQPNGLFYDKNIKNNKHIVQFQVSPDESKLFIFGFAKSKNNEKAIYSIYTYYHDYELEITNTPIDYEVYRFIQDDVIVDNLNNLLILFQTQEEDYIIEGVINPVTGTIYEWKHDFNTINKKMVLKDNNILIAGIGYQGNVFLIYQTLFNPKKMFFDGKTTVFDIKYAMEYIDKKTVTDLKKNISNLPFLKSSIDDIKFTEDGSTILYGEQYRMQKPFNATSMTHSTDFLWVAYINSDNNIISLKTIPKKQEAFYVPTIEKPIWTSYIPVISRGEIYFIFHDPKKNLKKDLHKTLKPMHKIRAKSTSICHVTINGKATRMQWIDNNKTNIYISPVCSFTDKDGNLVLVSTDKKQMRLGKLILD